VLDDSGVVAATNWFCREFQKTYSCLCIERRINLEEGDIPDSLKTPIFRISPEALNNVAKHGKATFVNLSLQKIGGEIKLMIQDNGQGFEPGEMRSRVGALRGLGLDSMRERAELSGGSFTIESTKGKGAIIRASWSVGKSC
jgi:signal transduction histidine kinase